MKLDQTKLKSKLQTNKEGKNIALGSIIATLIAITPYLFYLYESVPDTKVWNTFLFTYHSGYLESANVGMWVLTGKIIPLYLLFIWFFTCRHWWYHVLLIPIAMYSYQVYVTIAQESQLYVDDNKLIYIIPIMAIIIPSVYLVRAQIFNKINEANKSMQELEDEFKVSPKSFWEKVKQYF